MNATNIYKRKTPPLSNGDAKNTTDAPLNNNANNSISNNGASFKNKNSSSSSPTTLQINNISVHFPFTPYDVQTKYMKSVLDALRGGQHALLESPTVRSLDVLHTSSCVCLSFRGLQHYIIIYCTIII